MSVSCILRMVILSPFSGSKWEDSNLIPNVFFLHQALWLRPIFQTLVFESFLSEHCQHRPVKHYPRPAFVQEQRLSISREMSFSTGGAKGLCTSHNTHPSLGKSWLAHFVGAALFAWHFMTTDFIISFDIPFLFFSLNVCILSYFFLFGFSAPVEDPIHLRNNF